MSNTQNTQVSEQQTFFEVMRERRSVRTFDPSVRISREEITEIIEQATLAPSSANMQPWRFLVIDKQELKQKLLPIAFNQQQVVNASAVIAIFGDVESYKKAEKIFGQAVKAGFMSADVAKVTTERMVGLFKSLPPEVAQSTVYTDGGLVAMQLMLIARAKGYDTVPMDGYDKAKLVEAFGIPAQYKSVMLIAIGKATAPGHPTTRLPIWDVAFFNEI